MGIDQELFRRPAIRGEFTGPIIDTSLALSAIARALEALASPASGDPGEVAKRAQFVAEQIEIVRQRVNDLDAAFDELTGWTPDK